MSDEQHCFLRLRPDLQQLLLHGFAGLRVERRERLVHQQDLRIHHQRACKVHALLHAARQLVGIVVLEAGKADHRDEMRRAFLGLAPADIEAFQPVEDVVEHGPPRQQRGVLEHHGAVRPRLRYLPAVDQDAAGGRGDQAVDHREERGLAAAGRPHDRDEFAGHDLQVHAVERREARIGAGLEIVQPNVACFELGAHAAAVDHAGGRQTSTRRSMRCTISTNITPAATMVSTPTNTLSV